ncbi:hypothetical protein [Tropicibacter alexandrii]|uniref:hypothetical protein n=1 Tax=Tropicibacter alexandrii TaxID=2267683 RepID=UPI000EF50FE6|nr:hypothetical protein [Tropicibacter alexandrii]
MLQKPNIHNPTSVVNDPSISSSAADDKSVHIDVEKYQRLFDNPKLSETEKEQMVRSIWALLMAMIDLGFVLKEANLEG